MKKSIQKLAAFLLAAGMTCAALPTVSAEEELEEYLPINRDRPVYSDNEATAYASNNNLYFDGWQGSSGSYLAYDMSNASHLDQIDLVWYSGAWGNYDYTVLPESAYASLGAYTIEVNKAPGGSYPETGWEEVVTVNDCTTHSGEHLINFAGYNWVRLWVNATQNGNAATLNIDIHAKNDGVVDTWMFYGDSITACGMTTFGTDGGNFADFLHELDPSVYPGQQNGGIGGIRSIEGKANIDKWLAAFPGQYVSIAYGTNDCWGNQTGAEGYYENTVYMIEKAQKAGKTVILPKIPFSLEPGVANYVQDYNAMIDKIYKENSAVIPGPDFYAYFEEHPEHLSGDGVHPSSEGYAAMRKLWAETMYEKIYKSRGSSHSNSGIKGDVNGDEAADLADAVLLVRYLTNDVTDLPAWTCADMNEDGKLNGFDLTLLKHYLLRTDDEKIDEWLQDWSGKFHVVIDYSAWTSTLTDISADCSLGCQAANSSVDHLVSIEVPKLDPREAGIHTPVTVTVTMTAENGNRVEGELTFYQYVYSADGALAALYSAANYTVLANGSISTGVSR